MHASDANDATYILLEVPSDRKGDYSDDEMLESINRNTHELYLVVTSDCKAPAKAKVLEAWVSPVAAQLLWSKIYLQLCL